MGSPFGDKVSGARRERVLARRRQLSAGALGHLHLAIHAWDEPAETLLAKAPARGVHLVMPRLGAPVEPSRVERVEPWWRVVGAPVDEREAAPGAPVVTAPIGDPIG